MDVKLNCRKTIQQNCPRPFYLVALLLFDICVMDGRAVATTGAELRQIAVNAQPSILSARLEYTEKYDDNRPELRQIPSRTRPEIQEIRKHRFCHITSIIDMGSNRQRRVVEDLRDIDKLLNDYGLPESQRVNIDMTRTDVTHDNLEMVFADVRKGKASPNLVLSRHPGEGGLTEARQLEAGLPPIRYLSVEWSSVIEEVREGDREFILVTATRQLHNQRFEMAMKCDPALGYRFTHLRRSVNGRLVKEEIADDYRDVDGTPFPFRQVTRFFDEEGKVIRERNRTFTDVKFNVEVSSDDFLISVPAGTRVHNVAMMDFYTLDGAQTVSPADLLGDKI